MENLSNIAGDFAGKLADNELVKGLRSFLLGILYVIRTWRQVFGYSKYEF